MAHLRTAKLAGIPPSSPSMALFQDGKPVYVMHRGDIERREAPEIAGFPLKIEAGAIEVVPVDRMVE